MFGDNPIRKPVTTSGDVLAVQAIFATFQGEGPFAGEPAVFLRLGGCNLACKFCDTEFESFSDMHIAHILEKIADLAAGKRKLVVITGGEPMRQPIEDICSRLIQLGYKVQIETNGTIHRNLDPGVFIICSPKNTGYGYKRIREDLLPRVSAIKFIVSRGNSDYYDIAEVGQTDYNLPVYVQPMDEGDQELNRGNIKRALAVAEQYGYRISLQMHKILEIE